MVVPGLGVLAFCDSITNCGGELQWGVAMQSWAMWVARSLGLPYSGYAVDGATVSDIVELQMPLFSRVSITPDGPFELGCLYIGVNDVRMLDWDPAAFERQFVRALEFLDARCERVLTMTAPLDLGRPRAGAKVLELNAIIGRCSAAAGALLVDLSDFGARNMVMADHVHPTAFGQIAIAERALAVLSRDGLPARVPPRSLIAWSTDWRRRLQSDVTYTYRHAKVSASGLRWLARARLGGDR
jgi:lysophospholipase L1-like esterase